MNNKNKSAGSVIAVIIVVLFCLGLNAVLIGAFIYNMKLGKMDFTFIIMIVAMDLIIIFSAIAKVKNSKKKKILAQTGKEYTATFVSYGFKTIGDGVAKYYIQYKWTDNQGIERTDKTGYDYSAQQAVAFQLGKTFKIKASENYSQIISIPVMPARQGGVEKKDGNILCEYCGSVYSVEKTKCPNCGATRKKQN